MGVLNGIVVFVIVRVIGIVMLVCIRKYVNKVGVEVLIWMGGCVCFVMFLERFS